MVVEIPIGGERVLLAQVVDRFTSEEFYLAVYQGVREAGGPVEEDLGNAEVALLALSLDALIYHHRWPARGTVAVRRDLIPWPAYKLSVSPQEFVIVNHTGTKSLAAGVQDAERFPFRKTVAPIRVQRAAQALVDGNWDSKLFDSLLPVPPDQREVTVFGAIEMSEWFTAGP